MSTTFALEEHIQVSSPGIVAGNEYNLAIGYLRAFITVLVLAHHAVLAYIPFAASSASLGAQPRLWQAFPVVDSQRFAGFGLLVGFNDIFFMSLMFFLSGLFVWNGLRRKGAKAFLRNRFLRLGLPFTLAAAVIAPLAYYPAYLTMNSHPSLSDFWRQWLALGSWPAGPAWFVWVLLAFDIVAAGIFVLLPKWGEALAQIVSGVFRRPITTFALLVALSAAAYLPMELVFNGFSWTVFGPFSFQTSRLFHYAIYFLAGTVIGAFGLERGVLAADGKLARRWPLWSLAALVGFGASLVIFIQAFTSPTSPHLWETTGDCAFALSCAASSFAFLAIFRRFAQKRVKAFDSLTNNAYGMYLVHYAFVSWLQYLLLRAALPGAVKGSLVFLGTLGLSWATVAVIRRIPAVARVI